MKRKLVIHSTKSLNPHAPTLSEEIISKNDQTGWWTIVRCPLKIAVKLRNLFLIKRSLTSPQKTFPMFWAYGFLVVNRTLLLKEIWQTPNLEVLSWDSGPNFGLVVFFINSFSIQPPTDSTIHPPRGPTDTQSLVWKSLSYNSVTE